MYLPTLTNDELLRYADTLTLTPLEAELVSRLAAEVERTNTEIADLEQGVKKNLEEEVEKLNEQIASLEDDLSAAHRESQDLQDELDSLKDLA